MVIFFSNLGAYAGPIGDEEDITAGYVVIHTAKSCEAAQRQLESKKQVHKAERRTSSTSSEKPTDNKEYLNITRAVFTTPEDLPGIVPGSSNIGPSRGCRC